MADITHDVSIDESIQSLRKFAENLAYLLLKQIQYNTPVDTGLLQSSWTKSVAKDGSKIEFDNPVEYAGFVEFGTDKMAPRAMVRRTLENLDMFVEQALTNDTKFIPVGSGAIQRGSV